MHTSSVQSGGRRRDAAAPTPFIKWAGGKGQLLGPISASVPPAFARYVEPFLGGGAVFFHLRPEAALLSDLNSELIACYHAVQERVDELMAALDRHVYSAAHYYEVRAARPEDLSPIDRAARFIFLNKTGYNGLYRVNREGAFNVPFGRYKKPPKLYDRENLQRASAALKRAVLRAQPYELSLAEAEAGDFVYLDPPYQPVSSTANFTSYTSLAFSEEDQRRLAEWFRRLDARGCPLMLSNSDTPLVRELYGAYRQVSLTANRAINSNPSRRRGATELLVMNY
jgi:DNA adenine methylase